jgi:signal transduction histidine kinase
VHIELIVADRKEHEPKGSLQLPPLIRDLRIDYTALSLVAPEKVRFRYKLEGKDIDWQDAGERRQAFYNDLPPRSYRFRVMACNNSGVWNEAGASFDFSIDPKFYQTDWFRASCVAAFLGMLWWSYRMRLRYIAAQFNMRLDERVNERTRIARDLHDTMLQSFQGVLLKFHAVTFALPDRPAEAKKNLEKAIEEARAAIAEGRDAVQGLRSSTVLTEDIALAITTLGEGLAAEQGAASAPRFCVYVEGTARTLTPILRDELYRVAAEALRNAFRHAGARRIEVSIQYDKRELRLRVRDDGKGIDPQVLAEGGRAGHHGLPGMQERAKLAGGKLAVWSQLDSGTEIELSVSGAIAYAKTPAAPQARTARDQTPI